ncbi:Transcription factor bHLH70 [Platanthera zijinensis]|uniref:Transcription factor bHLH70 n=1 Tax=Platanthera zijinensis TaxID=2320716 RepID=A0AAP0BC84_9ASPA
MEKLHRDINSFFQLLEECMDSKQGLSSGFSAHEATFQREKIVQKASSLSPAAVERKKRKRAAVTNGGSVKAEAENQRITHIVVERNRRRLMNEHLVALRSIMPPSFVQRGDQASIVGGAIDFVKELEQMLYSLRAEKNCRLAAAATADEAEWSLPPASSCGFLVSPQYTGYSWGRRRGEEESEVDVEATAVQGHVNLKVAGRRRPGQLVRVIAAMEELRLTVLHLSITCLDAVSVLYSLNLKVSSVSMRALISQFLKLNYYNLS